MFNRRLKNWFYKLLKYSPEQFTKNQWNLQYSSTRWDYLRNIEESARNSIIGGYIRYKSSDCTILDVCCGEGVLQNNLGKHSYKYYVGVDISSVAIAKAEIRINENTTFICSDAETFIPSQKFSVIVFNECLYHFESHLKLLAHYESFLLDNGIFIVSMYANTQSNRIWRMLDAKYEVEDSTKVTNSAGISWIVKQLKPC
jgi:2-polyprenyl-3-methyl-5-hydroxy-6-metoxy-1,4-benzoquinol methylase